MQLTIPELKDGKQIPKKFTKEGDNISPSLEWFEVPGDAQELALLFENVTPQTREPQLLWLAYGILPQAGRLPEGFKHEAKPEQPAPIQQGTNALGNVGYDGPIGTVGKTDRYRFRLLALDESSDVEPGADEQTFRQAASGHVIGESTVEVEWERPRP